MRECAFTDFLLEEAESERLASARWAARRRVCQLADNRCHLRGRADDVERGGREVTTVRTLPSVLGMRPFKTDHHLDGQGLGKSLSPWDIPI